MYGLPGLETRYPWYDSKWLAAYVLAKNIIQKHCPARLAEFIAELEILTTSADFQVKELESVIDIDTLYKAKEIINGLKPNDLSKDEVQSFGRNKRQNLPFFNQLQCSLTDLVSEAVNEEVEPCYNFLSLYRKHGVCEVHMDAPEAKWTLDICIEQSVPWPIYFSQVQCWPEDFSYKRADWARQIKDDPSNTFTPYVCQPADGILFSGSSQWHYRDRIPTRALGHHSNLIFFHYTPKAARELIKPGQWQVLFDIPELELVANFFNRTQTSQSA